MSRVHSTEVRTVCDYCGTTIYPDVQTLISMQQGAIRLDFHELCKDAYFDNWREATPNA
jgi:hypothetical protein